MTLPCIYCTTPIVRPSGGKLSYSYTHERRGCGEDREVDVCVTHPTSSNRLFLLVLPNLVASHPNRTRLFQVAHPVRRCQGLTRSLSTLRHATFSTFARFTRYSSSRSDKSCYLSVRSVGRHFLTCSLRDQYAPHRHFTSIEDNPVYACANSPRVQLVQARRRNWRHGQKSVNHEESLCLTLREWATGRDSGCDSGL